MGYAYKVLPHIVMAKRKYPPSYYRYREPHPAISVRLTKSLKEALFTVPCSMCRKPMVFTHRDSDWQKKVKPRLHILFADWFHTVCKKKQGSK
jgi:hypothetical protein